ncbi:prepilin-type N-terminal cleavage/methylation domain-containing protein [Thalassospira xiamenensis]|uniref:Prepilin-type N-terminal cleavage/methylation domain-containing protein n=1 Tax=Thalassospira xiamenensis TaxID=220697 RepID=A0A285TSQ5_9PROT|nr:prepilin-type N-terminal cleavage/methylation domain-containing protein [Thalassospira xiamenensis]SOC26614.1 prepilin-type N-terminal cleavage/methylation domain-containing protein [Thalassospira xiamenensis]
MSTHGTVLRRHWTSGRRQVGFGLLELSVAIGIFALLVVGAYAAYLSITHAQRVRDFEKVITQITSSVGDLYKGQAGFDEISPQVLASAGGVASKFVRNRGTLSEIVVADSALIDIFPDALGQRYVLVASQLNEDLCVAAARMNMKDRLDQVFVGSNDRSVFIEGRPLTLEEAIAVCSESTNSTVGFSGRLYEGSIVAWVLR